MNFAFSDEQEAFRDTLRRFLESASGSAAVRKHMEMEEGFDRALWRRLSVDLGLPALEIPEAYGGAGFGFLELTVAFEEMGRSLACAPFFSTVLASYAVLNAGSEADKADLLPGVASGERIATLALVDAGGGWEPGAVRMTYEKRGADYVLTGAKSAVTDGASADLLLVAARRPGTSGSEGVSLFAVEGNAEGVKRTPTAPLDLTRRIA
ncbi:MAG: acyl-CoA dehydrogenase family protein, partial [Candidatus Methylomirabilis sp.]|nr:acyl-CoA dehydrogenase family protein [Deltaproteobacteria bacterium]